MSQQEQIQNLVNHIALVVDASGSMGPFASTVVKVFDKELKHLKKRSVELNQETRISIYLFGVRDDAEGHATIKCLAFDMDVMRFDSLAQYYTPFGNTPLVSGTTKAIVDMTKIPELYGDHAFLVYVLTDGEENRSTARDKEAFPQLIRNRPENWTIACLVPNQTGVFEATKFGFPRDSVSIWDVSERGLEEAGEVFTSGMERYMTARAAGIRSTKTFFQTVSAKDLKREDVKENLIEVKSRSYKIVLNDSPKVEKIQELVISKVGKYEVGKAYYHLIKKETIHASKEIVIQDAKSGKVYRGSEARKLLQLPTTSVAVAPGDFGMWNIFVQSTSVNRNVLPNQKVLYFV